MTLPIRRYLPQLTLDNILQISTIKWTVVCFTLLMDDGYCVPGTVATEWPFVVLPLSLFVFASF